MANDAVRVARRAFFAGSPALAADDALDRDGGGFTATDAEGDHAALEVLGFECMHWQYVAHENLIDPLGRQLGPFQRRADHVGAGRRKG
ncbi:hypothetical protein V1294_002184 [Bradyrhizobium sp. AZCC 1678]